MSKKLLALLVERFGDKVIETHSNFGDDTAVLDPSIWREAAKFLRDDPRAAMNMIIDVTAADYVGRTPGAADPLRGPAPQTPERTPRFEVICHLRSFDKGHRIRIKTRVGDEDGDGAIVDSLVPVWRGANWLERETFDMFGIQFRDHPDLRRILMYPEFVGHPLRKDYPAQRTQPLVAYREGNFEKLAPFGDEEGMPFGRKTHADPREPLRRGPASSPNNEEQN